MGLVSVNYHPDSGGLSGSGRDQSGSVSYRVELDSPLASEHEASYHTPVYIGQPYEHHGVFRSYLRASSYTVDREGSNSPVWRVDVEYSARPPPDSGEDNPLDDPADDQRRVRGSVTLPVLGTVERGQNANYDRGRSRIAAGQPYRPAADEAKCGRRRDSHHAERTA